MPRVIAPCAAADIFLPHALCTRVLQGDTCTPKDVCRDCSPETGCFPATNYTKYYVSEYGEVKGEADMMKEIHERGPIVCGVAVPDTFEDYHGGIYEDRSGTTAIGHAISVVGWGVENGVKFWIARNSWGTYWGEEGWFRIVRGVNNLGIEQDCQVRSSSRFPMPRRSVPRLHMGLPFFVASRQGYTVTIPPTQSLPRPVVKGSRGCQNPVQLV